MSAPHRVIPNEAGRFDVISGRTGRLYHVVPSADPQAAPLGATCDCEWGHRSAVVRNVPCSHVRAVHEFAANAARERAAMPREATPTTDAGLAARAFRRAAERD